MDLSGVLGDGFHDLVFGRSNGLPVAIDPNITARVSLGQSTGAESCLLRLRHAHSGGPSHAQIMKTIHLIGDRIIPYMG